MEDPNPQTQYRTALVTGASSGIGRGLSAWLAYRGIRVFAAARRIDALEQLRQETGANIVPVQLDCAQANDTEARVRQLDEECAGLDLVVANAGIGEAVTAKRVNWPAIHQMLNVNVVGATATLLGALPKMIERRRGHLVGISSLSAFVAPSRLCAYGASKAYLAAFLEGLQGTVAAHGVSVSAIFPGYVQSEMTAGLKKAPPMLMETDDAVEAIGKAIFRRAPHYAFPWPVSMTAKAIAGLPRPLSNALRTRLMK
jgi:short-subunit dehydrogenase